MIYLTLSLCLVDPCQDKPCKNNAVCEISSENSLEYKCICNLGFTGSNCQTGRVF